MYCANQVLVPVDFSNFSRCALAFARQLGTTSKEKAGSGAKLQLAHAIEAMPDYVRAVLFPYAALGEDDRAFEAEIEQSVRQKLTQYFDIDDELRHRFLDRPKVEFGAAKEWIGKWATSIDVEMVAVGTFGTQGVYSGGPGSTSRRIASTSTKPVALIRDFDPKPRIKRILAAVALGRDAARVVDVALGLAVDLEAELELLHVIPTPFLHDTKWMLERSADITAADVEAQIRPQAEALIAALVENTTIPFAHRKESAAQLQAGAIRFGDPAEEIAKTAYDEDFDLVVVGGGGRQTPNGAGVGRVASAVMAEVPKHLVVVPGVRDGTPLERWGGQR